jgi:hypothetical protein
MGIRVQAGLAVLVAGLVSVGCAGEKPPAAKPAAPAPGAANAAASTGAAAAGSEFGVPECDLYVKNYQACLDSKVPEAARAMVRQSFDQTRAAWRQAAATPEGRQGLAAGCTQAEAMAKQAMAAYGCRW